MSIIRASDIQQTDSVAAKRLVKQSDKQIRRGNLPEAEKLLRLAVSESPDDSNIKLRLALVCVKQRHLREAYDTSFEIARNEPQSSFAFAVLGTTLLNAGRFAEARPVLFTSLKIDRSEGLAWAGLGMLEFYENNIEESVLDLRQAVYLEPNDADYYFVFAQVSARAEHYKDAADAYMKFLELSQAADDDRRERIRGLISFLHYLGERPSLYETAGESRTDVKFELAVDRPVIRLKVNDRDQPMRFVLDTGSGISVISDKTAALLHIKPISRGGFAKGIGGSGRFAIVYGFLRQVQIGGVKMRNVPVYIRKFQGDGDGQQVDGYIGLSLISKFLTTIDYGTNTFSLAKKDLTVANADDDAISLPLRLTSSGFLSGEVQLEGIQSPLNFIVDTGASVSVISDDVARLETITPFILDGRVRVIGSAGITDDVRSYLLPKVSFGKHSCSSVTAIALDLDMINEASGFEQAGILGGNFLKNYRMTFDFKNSRVIFVPVDRAP
ncbi:MAG: aspartyl protease family protein [Pyrinomonadaceae bacterium]